MGLKSTTRLSLALSVLLAAGAAQADAELTRGLLAPGEVGFLWGLRFAPSAYEGGEREEDFLPTPLYESKHLRLQATRAALKLDLGEWDTELFVERRHEGFALDRRPASMTGMAQRERSADLGLYLGFRLGEGALWSQLTRDVGGASHGSELRLGYRYERWWQGRLRVRPYAVASLRDSRLNNYYYGVRPEEATPERAAYEPGAGVDLELGLQAAYRMAQRWQLVAGLALERAPADVQDSPVAADGARPSATLGVLYGFETDPVPYGERKPLIVRLMRGEATECGFLRIVALTCTGRHQREPTDIWAIEIGEPLVRGLNGWPLDFAFFFGLLWHEERGLQSDFWQIQAYLKTYFYGFPWRDHLRTRLGFGAGAAYAKLIPFPEARDQLERGRDTSRLLFYMDPTFDLSLGDLTRSRSLRDTWLGVGVSHRSGIFGWNSAFNNVNGGSNYIYGFVETSF
jgi:outer membrane protein